METVSWWSWGAVPHGKSEPPAKKNTFSAPWFFWIVLFFWRWKTRWLYIARGGSNLCGAFVQQWCYPDHAGWVTIIFCLKSVKGLCRFKWTHWDNKVFENNMAEFWGQVLKRDIFHKKRDVKTTNLPFPCLTAHAICCSPLIPMLRTCLIYSCGMPWFFDRALPSGFATYISKFSF